MKIMFYCSESERAKIHGFLIESKLRAQVNLIHSFEQAMSYILGDHDISLILIMNPPHAEILLKYLHSIKSTMPVLFLNENGSTSEVLADLRFAKYNLNIQETSEDNLLEFVSSHLDGATASGAANSEDYVKFNVGLLKLLKPLPADIFARLSHNKFVKIFAAGAFLSGKDFERSSAGSGASNIYIRRDDANEFVSRLQTRLQAQPLSEDRLALLQVVTDLHEAAHEMFKRFGPIQGTLDLVRTNVDIAVKAIGKFQRVQKLIDGTLLTNANYISKHSILTAQTASALATQMNWPSESTSLKLTLAAFIHDLPLLNEKHAKFSDRLSLENAKRELSPSAYNSIESHPVMAAQLVNKFTEIPGDVFKIVLEHHEQPDGSGFPARLTASAISPLSSVFIVAHELVDQSLDLGPRFDIERFWDDKEKIYTAGTFKKILITCRNKNRKVS